MKVNFEKVLVDMDGVELKDTKGGTAKVRGCVVDALLATYQDEQNLAGEEKMKRFDLATKIYKGEDDVVVEDITLIKKLVGKAYTPIVVGQVWRVLEGE
jgi:hypothetical protein